GCLCGRGRSRVVVNGVGGARLAATALDRSEARKALGLPASGPVVGCAARFDRVKRLDMLLRAVARVSDTTLRVVLVGRGAEERRLRGLAVSLGLGGGAGVPVEVLDVARGFSAFDLLVGAVG